MSHTPGPWRVGSEEPFVYALNGAGTNRFFLHVQPGWLAEGRNKADDKRTSREELMANARLIAAAPDMLEAIRAYVEGRSGDADELLHAAFAKATTK